MSYSFNNPISVETACNVSFKVEEITKADRPHILLLGNIDTYSGYANHCRGTLSALNNIGRYNVKLKPLKSLKNVDDFVLSQYKHNIYMDKFPEEDYIYLGITSPGYMQKQLIPKCKKSFVWTMTETNDIPSSISELSKNVDYIITPTMVDKNKFHRAGVHNVHYCPIGYNSDLYNKNTKPLDIVNLRGRYVFGMVGAWNARKNQEAVVKAYCKSFRNTDRVSLLICTHYAVEKYNDNPNKNWDTKSELYEYINKACQEYNIDRNKIPHITLIEEPIHENIMPSIYSRFNCLVGCSTGESTWLPGLEAAAIGRPIINLCNPDAGYMDYLYDNPYMCTEYETRELGEEFYKGINPLYKACTMNFGSVLELSDKMMRVYVETNSSEQKSLINVIRERVINRTWKDSTNKLVEILFN